MKEAKAYDKFFPAVASFGFAKQNTFPGDSFWQSTNSKICDFPHVLFLSYKVAYVTALCHSLCPNY